MAVQEFEIEVSGHRAFVYKENSFAPDDPYKFYLPFVRGQGCWTVSGSAAWRQLNMSARSVLIQKKARHGYEALR